MDDYCGLEVAVAGAGIGGLALAQGLRSNGIRVRVYERDPAPEHRRQGYRIHISEVGERAMAATLPADVHRGMVETATLPGDLMAGYDTALRPVFEQVHPPSGPDAVVAVDRLAFRRALLAGLGDVVSFGREVVGHAETSDGRVGIRFADGTTTAADVLVVADGVGSRLVPGPEVVDIGVRCLYGRLPLGPGMRESLPAPFLRGFCFVSDGRGLGVAIAPVLFREPPAEYGDYLMTVLTGTNESLGIDDGTLFSADPETLWAIARERTAGWAAAVREVVAQLDPSATFPITLRTCLRVDEPQPGPVTVLGDAAHPMTPAAGAGANTALHDAALLTRSLRAIAAGDVPLRDALARYGREMVGHAAPVVAESLRNAEQFFGVRVPVAGR